MGVGMGSRGMATRELGEYGVCTCPDSETTSQPTLDDPGAGAWTHLMGEQCCTTIATSALNT